MDAEWQLLQALADENRSIFASIARFEHEFRVAMRESPAWVSAGGRLQIETDHTLRYVYPRFYPALPLEGYFLRPIAHINVEPATGFVCLWQDFRPGQTIIDAIVVTRAILACKAVNYDPGHRMRPESPLLLAELPMLPLTLPAICRPVAPRWNGAKRRRLSSQLDEQVPRETSFAFSDTE
jgi:hypothetical protein